MVKSEYETLHKILLSSKNPDIERISRAMTNYSSIVDFRSVLFAIESLPNDSAEKAADLILTSEHKDTILRLVRYSPENSILYTKAHGHADPDIRAATLRRHIPQEELEKIILDGEDEVVIIEALGYLKDISSEVIKKVLPYGAPVLERLSSVAQLIEGGSRAQVIEAILKSDDADVLEQAFAYNIFRFLDDNEKYIKDKLVNHPNEKIQESAIKHLNDKKFLRKLLKTGSLFQKLSVSKRLEMISNAPDWYARKRGKLEKQLKAQDNA